MNMITPVAEFGHYLLFSLLVGHVALQFVPDSKKPMIKYPKSVLLLCTLGIIIFTFIPVLQAILFFKNDVGVAKAASTVLTTFNIGHVWIFITIFSIFLWLAIYLERSKYIQAFWILLIVMAVGYGSHVSSKSFIVGIFSHSTHFLMVTIWVGILLHAAWFSKGKEHWAEFLQWFTPLALVCMVNIFATGFVLMFTIESPDEYLNGWASSYGRMLLFKHISIFPVIAFAIINGFLSRKISSLTFFDPRIWLRSESIILFFVFYFTGILGTLSPPDNISIQSNNVASPTWIDWLFARNLLGVLQIEFTPSLLSIIIILVSILFLGLIILSFKFMSPSFAIIFGGCFIITMYLGLMFSVTIYSFSGVTDNESTVIDSNP